MRRRVLLDEAAILHESTSPLNSFMESHLSLVAPKDSIAIAATCIREVGGLLDQWDRGCRGLAKSVEEVVVEELLAAGKSRPQKEFSGRVLEELKLLGKVGASAQPPVALKLRVRCGCLGYEFLSLPAPWAGVMRPISDAVFNDELYARVRAEMDVE